MEYESAVNAAVIIDGKLLVTAECGNYSFPGGRIEVGESIDHALARKGREEIGAPLNRSGPKLGIFESEHDGKLVQGAVYECDFSGDYDSLEAKDVDDIVLMDISPELREQEFLKSRAVIDEIIVRYGK